MIQVTAYWVMDALEIHCVESVTGGTQNRWTVLGHSLVSPLGESGSRADQLATIRAFLATVEDSWRTLDGE